MLNFNEKSTEQKIVSLVEEMVVSLNEVEKQNLLKEMELKKGLAAANALKGSVKKNNLKLQDFVDIVRKVRIKNGWNIA